MSGCNRQYNINTDENGKDEGFKENSTQKNEKMDLVGVPEDYQYMWEANVSDDSLPDKSKITRIAMYRYQEAFDNQAEMTIYGCIDFVSDKILYMSSQEGGKPIHEYELSLEDRDRYIDSINYEYLLDPPQCNGSWNIAIEYEDGECYAYNIRYDRKNKEDPKRKMLKVLFDKVEMNGTDASFAGLK